MSEVAHDLSKRCFLRHLRSENFESGVIKLLHNGDGSTGIEHARRRRLVQIFRPWTLTYVTLANVFMFAFIGNSCP